jgi:hypothetical protein
MQPLSLIRPNVKTLWGNHSVMIKHPALAVKMAQYVADWAETETTLAAFVALLLHANEKAVAAIYVSLENRAAQLRMITAAAQSSLTVEQFDVISLLLNLEIKPAMKYRDKLAHWCWGYTDELPDALLLREPRDKLAGVLTAISLQAATKRPIIHDVPTDNSTVFVIREPDLDRALRKLSDTQIRLRWALGTVWSENPPETRDALFAQLSSTPGIQEALEAQKKKRQKTQATQSEELPLDETG